MSAEIQTGLFILTAEVAGITTLAALVAGIVAWVRRKGRLKAAEALRASADRLPGEGEIVQKEKALLGEFARAYLTRDADVLASLPAQLLALRQMHEGIQVSEEAADTQQAEALQAEKEAFQARAEALEKQQALTAQQLEGTLSTINTLVQEYGRGRGQVVTPTAEAMLQALLQIQGQPAEIPDQDAIDVSSPDADEMAEVQAPPVTEGAAVSEPAREETTRGAVSETMDLAVDDELEAVPLAEPEADSSAQEEPAPEEPVAAPAPAVSNEDVDALLMDVLGESPAPNASAEKAVELAVAAEAEAAQADDAPTAQPSPKDEAMDLSVPVAKVQSKPPAPAHDDLDDLDIDALLDAEMGRQATLLTPAPASGEDLDLSRDTPPGK